ncbi:DUF4376 domain-containing protein [Rhizobium sp. No.120]
MDGAFPKNWYWLADDGRIFSSINASFVTEKDTDYQNWLAQGRIPTRWPSDDSGNQTSASLQAVVGQYGIFADLTAYAASKRYALEVGGFVYDGHPISTDRDSQSKISSVALAANLVGSTFSTSFKCADGTFFTLSQSDAIAMATAVMKFISGCFDTEATLVAAIASGKVKTAAAVDAASWPSNS